MVIAQVVLLLALIIAVLGHRFGLLSFMPGFYGFGLSLIFIIGIGLIGFFIYVGSFLVDAPSVRGGALAAFAVGASLMLIVVVSVGPKNFSKPLIHDITTDWRDPPHFEAALSLRKPGENSLDYAGETLGRIQSSAYPDLKALEVNLSQTEAFERASQTVEELGWQVIASDAGAGIIEAADRTPMLGFTDDVIIRIRPGSEGSRIDMRSASRVGQGDFGANARRIEKFFETFSSSL